MNNVVLTINQTHDILEADKFHSELRILDWIREESIFVADSAFPLGFNLFIIY